MTLQDVTVTHESENLARVSFAGYVVTVQANPRHVAAQRSLALACDNESRTPEGPDKEAATAARYRAQDVARQHDAWTYTLPPGLGESWEDLTQARTYSHPDKRGALHMARKAFVQAGVILVPFDHSHLNAGDRGRAVDLGAARARITGPRWGDFVLLPGQAAPVSRICGIGGKAGESFSLSSSGSYSLPSRASQLLARWQSYSGGLDWRPEYLLAKLLETDRHAIGRFWFFSGGVMAAGGGVDVALPCRVYRLETGA